jgi:outer membrane protein W
MSAQSFEVTPFVGGQINGSLDYSTTLFHGLDVKNGLSYGVTGGYLFGEYYGLEFSWNRNKADTTSQPISGGSGVKVFTLTTDQFFGQFVFHFTDPEHKLRPFVFLGLGATDLSTDRNGVVGATRFAGALGGGVKYHLTPHIGLRFQAKWSPTYLTTSDGGYWCDPFWGGCWVVGNNHYLHEFDGNVGLTFRF